MPKKPRKRSRYINLCQDLMFKKYFSGDRRLLTGLLNAFIRFPGGGSIKDLEILKDEDKIRLDNPALYPPSLKGKEIVLDISATLSGGEHVNIEMQAVNHKRFLERMVYYLASLYMKGAEKGRDWSHLRAAQSLIFTNFMLLPQTSGAVSPFSLRSDSPPHFCLTDHFRMTFVELGKFKAGMPLEGQLDRRDLWCYFLKEGGNMSSEKARVLAGKSGEMKRAVDRLEVLSQDEAVRREEEARDRFCRDYLSAMETAREEGLEKGLKKGMEKGLEKGRAEGLAAVAKRLLEQGLDLPVISGATGFSEAELRKMRGRAK